jgi:hypothetical protein
MLSVHLEMVYNSQKLTEYQMLKTNKKIEIDSSLIIIIKKDTISIF